jgi:SAM-dependent methyltransferase
MDDHLARVRANYDLDPAREWHRLEGGAQARLEWLSTLHILGRHLPPPDRSRHLLDAGGGPGRYTLAMARQGYRVTLFDLSPALLALAHEHLAEAESAVRERVVAVVEGSITDLSNFADAQFDAVLCLGAPLSHLPERAARQWALAEMRRVLRPAGSLIASVFNRIGGFRSAVQWPGAWDQIFPGHLDTGHTTMGSHALPVYAFWPEEFHDELTEAGFAVHRLYGLQGIGAHLQEEHLLAVMADPERWPLWRQAFLATYDRPDLISVSSHVLAVGRRSDTP